MYQQANGFDEIVVVEEGFPHSHEDEIHAVMLRGNVLIIQDGQDLSGNLSGT
jgi:hypothetical protein